jgi:RNA methyltransferase, TrmH family
VRRLRRLLHKRSARWEEAVCVIEGPDLVDAALASRALVEELYVATTARGSDLVSQLASRAAEIGASVASLEPELLARVADAQHPQPVLATVRIPIWRLGDLDGFGPLGFVMVLDNLRDPGNLGTIVRSSDAAGASVVLLTGDCVDPYNPKALRASAGSVFHLPVILGDLPEALSELGRRGLRRYATIVRGGRDPYGENLADPCAVVIGNEAMGLDPVSVALCDESLSIDMTGRAESLNAAVAASLIAFESLHQRRGTSPARQASSLET